MAIGLVLGDVWLKSDPTLILQASLARGLKRLLFLLMIRTTQVASLAGA
jgi:hypothetical protein